MTSTSLKTAISVLLVFWLTSCSTLKRDYQAIENSNSISTFEHFLEKHGSKNKAYVWQAKARLDELIEKEAWRAAKLKDSEIAYQQYLDAYPGGKYVEEALAGKRRAEEAASWERTKAQNTITGYRNFIREYPGSRYSNEARIEINKLIEEQDWERTKTRNTEAGYRAYLQQYPQGKYATQANLWLQEEREIKPIWDKIRYNGTVEQLQEFIKKYRHLSPRHVTMATERLQEIEKASWERAKRDGSQWGYQQYLQQFPYGNWTTEARNQIRGIQNAQEQSAWNAALARNSISGYRQYQKKYPNGRYYDRAEQRIIDLEVKAVFSGAHGKLPPMTKQSNATSSYENNEITVENDTEYTLTVLYSGPESKRLELRPKKKGMISLKKGYYKVAAKVNNPSVIPYAGEEQLNGGEYQSKFYIQTVRQTP